MSCSRICDEWRSSAMSTMTAPCGRSGEVQAAAAKLGLNVDVLEIRHARDVVPAFETLKNGTQALYVCPDALVVNTNHARINTLALGSRLATMHALRD
jgi:putative tryptophan/tyrosine transport system substrate-binding protein